MANCNRCAEFSHLRYCAVCGHSFVTFDEFNDLCRAFSNSVVISNVDIAPRTDRFLAVFNNIEYNLYYELPNIWDLLEYKIWQTHAESNIFAIIILHINELPEHLFRFSISSPIFAISVEYRVESRRISTILLFQPNEISRFITQFEVYNPPDQKINNINIYHLEKYIIRYRFAIGVEAALLRIPAVQRIFAID